MRNKILIGSLCALSVSLGTSSIYAKLFSFDNIKQLFSHSTQQDVFVKKNIESFVKNKISTYIDKYQVSKISIAITIDGQTRFYNYGLTPTFPPHPITFQTQYEIASITKPFTSVLTVYLNQQNDLALSKPIRTYMPLYNHSPIGQVTLLQLLTHTSSLPIYAKKSLKSKSAVIKNLKTWSPKHPIGTVRIYSNLGYGLIGQVIENITNKKYPQVLYNNILDPLHVPDTNFYNQFSGDNVNNFYLASSGLQSCSKDLIDFTQIMMNDVKVSTAIRNAINQTLKGYYQTKYFYQGLAWVLYPLPLNKEALTHQNEEVLKVTKLEKPKDFHGNVLAIKTGSDEDGYSSIIAFIPKKHLSIVLLSDTFIPSKERISFVYDVFQKVI